MKQKWFVSSFVIVFLSITAFAQNKVVTNFDLEKYKEKRVQAESDYDREVQRGTVPTRAELARREQERQKFLAEFARLSAVQQAEYWRSQAAELQNQNAAYAAALANNNAYNVYPQPQPVYYGVGYLPYYNNYFNGYSVGAFGYGNFGFGRGRIGAGFGFGNYQHRTTTTVDNSNAIRVIMPPPRPGTAIIAPAAGYPQNAQPHRHFR